MKFNKILSIALLFSFAAAPQIFAMQNNAAQDRSWEEKFEENSFGYKLIIAIRNNNTKEVEVLIESVLMNHLSNFNFNNSKFFQENNPLELALQADVINLEIVRMLLEKNITIEEDYFIQAIQTENVELMALLQEFNTPITEKSLKLIFESKNNYLVDTFFEGKIMFTKKSFRFFMESNSIKNENPGREYYEGKYKNFDFKMKLKNKNRIVENKPPYTEKEIIKLKHNIVEEVLPATNMNDVTEFAYKLINTSGIIPEIFKEEQPCFKDILVQAKISQMKNGGEIQPESAEPFDLLVAASLGNINFIRNTQNLKDILLRQVDPSQLNDYFAQQSIASTEEPFVVSLLRTALAYKQPAVANFLIELTDLSNIKFFDKLKQEIENISFHIKKIEQDNKNLKYGKRDYMTYDFSKTEQTLKTNDISIYKLSILQDELMEFINKKRQQDSISKIRNKNIQFKFQ